MPVLDSACLSCASVTPFEQLDCADGHGVECPEWICRGCGAAILAGVLPPVSTGGAGAPRRRARVRAA